MDKVQSAQRVRDEVPTMKITHRIRRPLGLAEVCAIVLSTIVLIAGGETPIAQATPTTPQIVSRIDQLPGVTVNSPWVLDFDARAHWAIGADDVGSGVLVRRDKTTGEWSTTLMGPDETAASAGTAIISTTQIAFVVAPTGGGARVVVIDTSTGNRVSSGMLPPEAAGAVGMGSSPLGFIFVVAPGNPTTMFKIATSTGAVDSTLTLPATNGPATAAHPRAGSMFIASASSPVKMAMIKTNPGTAVDSTTTLDAHVPWLYSPVQHYSTAWYGTRTTPGRVIAFSLPARTLAASFTGPAGSQGVKNLVLDASGDVAWYSTTVSGRQQLVNMRLSDGGILSTTPLESGFMPALIVPSDHFVEVVSATNLRVLRVATTSPPAAPADVLVDDQSERVTITWAADTVSALPVHYTATLEGHGVNAECQTVETTCSFSGLTNGRTYSVKVRASSIVGGNDSPLTVARPARSPDAPAALTGTRGNQSIDIRWTPGDDGGRPIERFLVVANPGNHTCITRAHRCTIGGLTNGVHYAISVRTETELGASPLRFTAEPIMPATIPSSPVHLTTRSVRRNRTIVVCAPNDAGGFRDASLRARIVRNGVPGELFRPSTSSTIRIGGNTAQSLAIEIHAVNAVGASSPITIPIDTNPVHENTSRSSQRSMLTSCDRRSIVIEIRP